MPPQPARRRLPPCKPLPASSNPPSGAAARADPPSQPSVLRSRFVVAEEDPEEEEGPEEEPEEEPMEEPDEEEPEEGVEEDYEEEGGEEMEEEQEVEEEEEEEEEEEIPEPIRKKRRNREFEVFVGGLPREAVEEDLERAFMGVGEVVEVRLVMRPNSNENKGFAFLRFATVLQARAAADLEYVKVMGKSCGVIRSNDNETLHVANICTGWTKADLVENLKAFKLENLEEVHLIDDAYNKGKNRGFAFLDFSTHMDAVAACSKLQKRDIFLGTDVRAEVSFANSSGPDEEYMSQVKSVFLDNLPTSWDEAKVVEHLEMFGEIERVQLARNMLTAKRKDFGFVYFTTRQAALDCIEKVNKDGVGKGDKKVMLKATLKRPMQKRPPRMLGDRRGYIGKGFGSRRPQSYGFDRSFSNRPTGSREYMDREFSDRPGGPSRFSPRGFGKRARSSPPRKYVDHSRREYVRKIPAVLGSRSRDPYLKNCSSGGHAPGTHQYFSATKYHLREPYAAADIYEPEHEHCEGYDYPSSPEYRQSYSEVDYDMVPISMTRCVRTRPNKEMGHYPQRDGPVYDEYSRDLPGDRLVYDRGEDTSRVYKSRYPSRGGALRYYYRTRR